MNPIRMFCALRTIMHFTCNSFRLLLFPSWSDKVLVTGFTVCLFVCLSFMAGGGNIRKTLVRLVAGMCAILTH